jgi:uncharacterized protein (TIGR02001 family)
MWALLCSGFVLGASSPPASSADLTANLAALSDFRFRGVSLSDREPALQAGVDFSHASGFTTGVLASTVRLGREGDTEGGIAGQGYLGWSGSWTQTLAWGAGLTAYAFPHEPGLGSLDYQELFLRIGSNDAQLGVHVSNSYFGSGAPSLYLSVSAARDLTDRFRLFAHAGWLSTGAADQSDYLYDHSQRLDARAGALFDLRWATLELSLVGATSSDDWCRTYRSACDPGLVLSVRGLF